MKQLASLLAITIAFTLSACKKDDSSSAPAPASGSAAKKDPAATPPGPKPAPAPTPPADPAADYVHVMGHHTKPKPSDPDVFDIKSFKVVKASFDPAKIEGGTADLELDLSSMVSNSQRRDEDVKGPDYLDVAKFATVAIHIDNVKKTGDNAYTADATVNAHGVEKKLPVEFTVLSTTADSIRIKGSHTFQRFDFSIGAPEGQDDSVAPDITIEMQLTLKKA